MSKIFYNDGRRFAHPAVVELPTGGPHWMDMHDMGHVHDRSFRQTYESSTFTWTSPAARAMIAAEADIPEGCTLALEARSAPSPKELESQRWRPMKGDLIDLPSADRAMQYRAVFQSTNGDRFPTLNRPPGER